MFRKWKTLEIMQDISLLHSLSLSLSNTYTQTHYILYGSLCLSLALSWCHVQLESLTKCLLLNAAGLNFNLTIFRGSQRRDVFFLCSHGWCLFLLLILIFCSACLCMHFFINSLVFLPLFHLILFFLNGYCVCVCGWVYVYLARYFIK